MKSLFLIPLACLASLNSCATYKSMRQDPSQPQTASPTEIEQPSPVATASTPVAVHTERAQKTSATTTTKGLRNTGPYMAPNVFNIPKQEDLQETKTSTSGAASSNGLTVPKP